MSPGQRRLTAAVVGGLIAVLAAALPVNTPGGRAAPAPDPDPTVSASPSDPPPPPAVEVTAQDIPVGSGYWQGAAETYRLTARVRNTGVPPVTADTRVTLPAGVKVAASAAGGGCVADGLAVLCSIPPRDTVTITIDVTVAPGLWRDPPSGTVQVRATAGTGSAEPGGRTATDEATFGLDFPPGPPIPGIDLGVSDPFLPADPQARHPSTEPATLEVRLANTGAVQAEGTVDVVTPPGVELATVPAECVTRVRVSAERERCQVGRVPAGQRLTLGFTLVVSRAARAEAPLLGSVHGSLTPAGQDPAVRQASYSVIVAPRPDERAARTDGGDPDVTVAQPRRGAGIAGAGPTGAGSEIGQPLSVLPMLVSIVGVFAAVAAIVVLPTRRRDDGT